MKTRALISLPISTLCCLSCSNQPASKEDNTDFLFENMSVLTLDVSKIFADEFLTFASVDKSKDTYTLGNIPSDSEIKVYETINTPDNIKEASNNYHLENGVLSVDSSYKAEDCGVRHYCVVTVKNDNNLFYKGFSYGDKMVAGELAPSLELDASDIKTITISYSKEGLSTMDEHITKDVDGEAIRDLYSNAFSDALIYENAVMVPGDSFVKHIIHSVNGDIEFLSNRTASKIEIEGKCYSIHSASFKEYQESALLL